MPEETAREIESARKRRGRVVAVGSAGGQPRDRCGGTREGHSVQGRSSLFIRPPYEFKVVDFMLTNFHLLRDDTPHDDLGVGGPGACPAPQKRVQEHYVLQLRGLYVDRVREGSDGAMENWDDGGNRARMGWFSPVLQGLQYSITPLFVRLLATRPWSAGFF